MEIDRAQRVAARTAGITLLNGSVILMFGYYYLGAGLIVPHNLGETTRNIIALETQFRIWLVCNLMSVVNFVLLSAALYVVLRPINAPLALSAAVFRLVYAFTWVVVVLDMLGALTILQGGTYLHATEANELQALAGARLLGNQNAYYVGLPFWGMASVMCSYLFFRSRYIPKPLAVIGIISSVWCVLCAFIFLVLPAFKETVDWSWFDVPMVFFEIVTGFWLLIKGLQVPATA
jgi:hypothetical protein